MYVTAYSVDGIQTIDSSTDSVLGITGSTAVHPSIFFFSMGCETAPADNSIVWYAGRSTAAGTNTAVTPVSLGPVTTASTTAAGENHTAEPTYTANAILMRIGLNQRATHTVTLDPQGCLNVPASANNGIGWYPTHASATPDVSMTLHFCE
jgi:hypothetical protein